MKDNKSTVAVSAGNKAFIFWRVSIRLFIQDVCSQFSTLCPLLDGAIPCHESALTVLKSSILLCRSQACTRASGPKTLA